MSGISIPELMGNVKSRLRNFVKAMPLARHQEIEDIIKEDLQKIENKLVELNWKNRERSVSVSQAEDLLSKERKKSGYTESSTWVAQTFFSETAHKRRHAILAPLSPIWRPISPKRNTFTYDSRQGSSVNETETNEPSNSKKSPYKIRVTDVDACQKERAMTQWYGSTQSPIRSPIREGRAELERSDTTETYLSPIISEPESPSKESQTFPTSRSFMYNTDGTRIKYHKTSLAEFGLPAILKDGSFEFAHSWEFDVVEFASRPDVANMPLLVLGHCLIVQCGLDVNLGLDMNRIDNWLRSIETAYRDNPFHNHLHGADVMCTTYTWFTSPIFKGIDRLLVMYRALPLLLSVMIRTWILFYLLIGAILWENMTFLDLLASLMAACAHDVGHDGVNNLFHVKMWTEVATRWNDISPLENLHASMAFNILYENNNNWLHTMAIDDQFYMRTLMVKLILATDHNHHCKHQENMRTIAKCIEQDNTDNSEVFILREGKIRCDLEGKSLTSRVPGEECEKTMVLKAAIHTADISNPAKPNRIAVH